MGTWAAVDLAVVSLKLVFISVFGFGLVWFCFGKIHQNQSGVVAIIGKSEDCSSFSCCLLLRFSLCQSICLFSPRFLSIG